MNARADSTISSPDSITKAARILRAGGIVAFPTETVYGLGAVATDALAVARVFEAKGRPSFDPLIVHVDSLDAARACVSDWPEAASELARRFWPGPLTLVLPRLVEVIPDIVTAGLPTVALRLPDHPTALALLRGVRGPIAAPSANRFGDVSPTTAEHVRESLGELVDEILDGGACRAGIESTIVSLAGETPTLLRPGATSVEEIAAVIGPLSAAPATCGERPLAPGMLIRHYATRTPLYLVDHAPADLVASRCGRLAFSRPHDGDLYGVVEVLSEDGDLREAAAGLFAAMRRLDAGNLQAILADRFPTRGLGLAINDRLSRACAR